ncbi:capping protein-inhibiting regulator of actin dynamics isoform X2 [Micropterus dolomieu]|uniref:capping protein-inhibiting regulator of actin dynamics isoform X2 n=1 Tax=Micropterus dolomieu TaxID=147949 RepID=UPI001E8D6FB5|nr:capping protein-inhibiting regulator of actin dynamics isoform X2 [Micropterus dolomieu]
MKRRMSPWGVGFGIGRSSDSAAMASGPPDVMANQEAAEVVEECSAKKKSKFQTFKKFFARKKRKDPPAAGAEAGLKASQSSDNVSKTSENNTLTRSEKDKGSGSKISLGSKALSHDSVFVSDSSEANEPLGASQDSIHGKVKSLQLQLKQAIRLGSPPSLMCVKRAEDVGTMSEDDGLPCSPPEYTAPHTVMNQAQRNSSISLEGIDSDDDQLSCAASSRAVSPLVVPGDFSQPASPFGCLDNSAAKHKLGLRYKARNKRKPVSRLEMKAEGDSVVEETLNASITEALEEREHQKATEPISGDELKTKVEMEEEADEDAEDQRQHFRPSLLSDKEEREEEEDESDTEQDVSRCLDTSSPPEPSLSEEEAPEVQPLPSFKPSSRASSVESPRSTPEPPAGPREYLMDPPGIAYGAEENRGESDLALRGEEDGVQENRDEESSFLQEVLSSLKTPIASCSLDVESEDVVLKIEEKMKEKEREDVQIEEGEEVKEGEAKEDELVGYQAGSVLADQTTEEEEEAATLSTSSSSTSCQDVEEEKVEDKDEDAAEEEEEELVVEHVSQHGQEEEGDEEEAEEVKPEEKNDRLMGNSFKQEEEREVEESEGEEEAIELEKEPEVEEEGREKKEEDDVEVKEAKERVEEAEEAIEEDRDDAEEMTETFPDTTEVEVKSAVPLRGADEGVDVVVGDDAVYTPQHSSDDEIPTEVGDQVFAVVHESQAASSQRFGEEKEDGEERVQEGGEIKHTEQNSNQGEESEANQPDADHTEQALDHTEQALDQTEQDLDQTEQALNQTEQALNQTEQALNQTEQDLDQTEKNLDQTEQDLEQGGVEISHLGTKQVENDQTEAAEQANVSSKPSSLSLPESHHETPSQDSGASTPSKTSTTTLHINLLSPSSEKVTSFFKQSSPNAYTKESETPSQGGASTEQNTASTEKEPADTVETAEEEKQSAPEEEATPPASVEETVNQPSSGSDQRKARFTIAPAWQRSLSVEDAKESLTPPSSPPSCVSSSASVVTGPAGVEAVAANKKDPEVKAEPASSAKVELVLSPGRARNAGTTAAKPQSNATPPPYKAPTSTAASTEVEGNPDNPFGVRLRKTSVLHRFSSEEENTEPPIEPPAPPTSCKVDSPQPVTIKPSISQPVSNKPTLPKKPDVPGDNGGKNKRISDPAAVRGGSDSPSWISVAKQKQRIYKENSLEEIAVKKEEQGRKSSLPMYVSSAASREHSNNTVESTGKVSPLEIGKPSVSVEKEARRTLSSPTPVASQPPKSQSLPCPVPPKPQVPPATAKHPPQPNPPQRSLSPPTPVPVTQKAPSCTSPPSLSKTATSSKTPPPQTTTLTSPPFSSRTAPEKSGSRAPGLSTQTPPSQRGLPPQALPQDEPPWMALAKKKAKAWSEMPQIVQ